MQTKLKISGTHCESCKALIEDVAQDVPGVQSCRVDYTTGLTEIEHNEQFDLATFKQKIESLTEYKILDRL